LFSAHKVTAAEYQEELDTINLEISDILLSLETKLSSQSSKIEKQQQMIGAYAIANSHLVRAPLARILGLVELLSGDFNIPSDERKVLLEKLKSSSKELDTVIQEVAKMLRMKPDKMIRKYKMEELFVLPKDLVGERN